MIDIGSYLQWKALQWLLFHWVLGRSLCIFSGNASWSPGKNIRGAVMVRLLDACGSYPEPWVPRSKSLKRVCVPTYRLTCLEFAEGFARIGTPKEGNRRKEGRAGSSRSRWEMGWDLETRCTAMISVPTPLRPLGLFVEASRLSASPPGGQEAVSILKMYVLNKWVPWPRWG